MGWVSRLATRTSPLRPTPNTVAGYVMYNDIGEDMAFTGSGQLTNMYHRRQFIWPNSVYNDGRNM